MRECEIDVLVATSPINITYFSDYTSWVDPLLREWMITPGGSSRLVMTGFAIVPQVGEPALVVNAVFAANAADLWVRDVRVFGELDFEEFGSSPAWEPRAARMSQAVQSPDAATEPEDALVNALAERGLVDARIGLELEGFPRERAERLTEALPKASIRDCTNLLRLLRVVKSEDEIDRLRRAAEVSEHAGAETLSQARPGTRMKEVAERYRQLLAELGANMDHFAFSPRGVGIATEAEYVLGGSDVLYVDFGCIYTSCFSDTGTTLVMPQAPRKVVKAFDEVRDCVAAGARAIRPGVRASAVHAAMSQSLAGSGMKTSLAHGHGIGLEVRDYPIIVPDNGRRIRDECIDVPSDLMLESNMVINLEAPIFAPGLGSVFVEQTFVVTTTGSSSLCIQDRARPIVAS